MTAAEALEGLSLPEGFQATVFAAEPDVRQPIAMATDPRGRLFVAENYTYAEASLNFDKTLRDRIIILEDTDQDGRFDNRTVFWDEGVLLTSIEVGFGGVWALCAPTSCSFPTVTAMTSPMESRLWFWTAGRATRVATTSSTA